MVTRLALRRACAIIVGMLALLGIVAVTRAPSCSIRSGLRLLHPPTVLSMVAKAYTDPGAIQDAFHGAN
ncbi:MAG: hypothetical protein A3K65_02675 [Euryarchaeota archaeon RBG_16_68_12]|nr:MAG: hypothetical protein A3K65_02675 [Euryarchaeota archaeon RBG_16_68_12]